MDDEEMQNMFATMFITRLQDFRVIVILFLEYPQWKVCMCQEFPRTACLGGVSATALLFI
jgi:hypothetical protein